MKLMYLAKRTRPDILLPVSFLATKSNGPNAQDMARVDHVLRYLKGTRDLGLTLRSPTNTLQAFADASYAVHPDAKGHTGYLLALDGGGAILAKSRKQQLVSRSSTEAEMIAQHALLEDIELPRRLLADLGYPQSATPVFQDNKSAIHLAHYGPGATGHSKHMDVRFFYSKQKIEDGTIAIHHVPTADMVADILTKPLVGEQFQRLRARLLGE
jgi:hypothetical protein